jgi:ethanolamine utilization protein EutN
VNRKGAQLGNRRALTINEYYSRFTINDLRIMQLARVIGTVVATVKNESLEGRKLLVVQTLNKDLQPNGKPMVAIDAVGAGVGELVFWCRGKEASFPFKREDTPTDCTIIGIVDSDAHVTNGSTKSARQVMDDSR